MADRTDFELFILDILKNKCRLRDSTVSKYFDTKAGWKILNQAFVHKSMSGTNYELLEFEGDVVLNLATVEYIRDKFPRVVSVKWVTRIKHTMISKKWLAELAIDAGFLGNVKYGPKIQDIFDYFETRGGELKDCKEYLSMYEDTLEALCGAINRILNKNLMKGVGYSACYNLIENLLDSKPFELSYKKVFDPKTRLKELFDAKSWNINPGLKRSLRVNEMAKMTRYLNKANRQLLKDYDPTHNFLAIGWHPVNNNIIAVASANHKTVAEHKAAEIVIDHLREEGIFTRDPSPYEK